MTPGKRGPKIPVEVRGFINQAAIDYPKIDRGKLADV